MALPRKLNPEKPLSNKEEVAIPALSSQEALILLEKHGPNELPASKPRSSLHILLSILREPMVLLLLAIGTIYLLIGDKQEALSLLGFLVLIIGITFYQEHRTERALEALRDLSSPRALVIRDGKKIRIPGREVVPRDLLVLSEGDRVAADSALLHAAHLAVDESLLTGESLPVDKQVSARIHSLARSLLDESRVYAGSTVVRGQGLARVVATGLGTELGKIGKSLQEFPAEKTALQREARRLVRMLSLVALLLCAAVVVTFALTRDDWLGGFLTGLTLAMAILPNELPAVLLIFLTAGAWRLSQNRVLARRIPVVETLGAATVLCVDKTGTLTQNRMVIQSLWNGSAVHDLSPQARQPLPDEFHEILEYGILASRPEPFDPMEKAFHLAGAEFLSGTEHLHGDWKLFREYPLTESLLAVSYAWKQADGHGFVIGAKGAPEAIADLCHLPSERIREIERQVARFASQGLRVLGAAKAFSRAQLPLKQHDLDFEFVGLIGLADPIRPDVPQAVATCQAAGIRVIMITGDHSETAGSIARRIGLRYPGNGITGPELDGLSDQALAARVRSISVFSRTLPQQKLRIVTAFKSLGEVVAMTGDGINDAPALKNADIGVAMGQRGTDVAREAASLVLLDDNFSSIVAAVRLGRRIFMNLRHAFAYLLAIHIPITAVSIIPVFFKLPLVLLPIHIAFLHLVIEPACTIVFEANPEDKDIMNHPPRKPDASFFSMRTLRGTLLQGVWVTCTILGIYLISLWRGQGEADARTLTFTTLMIANLGLIMTNTDSLHRRNRMLPWISSSALLLLAAILYIPVLRALFRFSLLHPIDLLLCLAAGAISVVWSFPLIPKGRGN